jgi:hypothetical protein
MKNIPRWSYASLSKFVLDANNGTYPIWLEGAEPITNDPPAWAELYMSGPNYHKTNGQWEFDMDVLIAVCVKKDLTDGHVRHKIRGHFQDILSQGKFNVYRYPDAENSDPSINDGSYLGCYLLRTDVPREIDGLDYGQPNSEIRVERATVEGYFLMTLDSLENT